jgi:membrane protease YdiL (CAAX protease family)
MNTTAATPGTQARSFWTAAIAVIVATAVTATMDATGYFMFSALALFPLLVIFWFFARAPAKAMGFVLGRPSHYGLALLHPLLVLGVITLISAGAGAMDLSSTDWRKAALNCLLVATSTVLMAMITEEGFFRGWLWATLQRTGRGPHVTLAFTSAAFALWHLPAVVLETSFAPPAAQIPVFMLNAVAMGAAWGLMRWISGSLVVASVGHGVWNGVVYSLFGFGKKAGALGIENTALYGPEIGILGLVCNVLFVAALWWWVTHRPAHAPGSRAAADAAPSPTTP